jgi:hypothetical protein
MSRTQMAVLARARKYSPRIPDTYCPVCDAEPGQRCIGRNGKPSKYPHSKRGRPEVSPMPDLSGWYRAMRPYEGENAKPRPDWLTV